MKTVLDPETAGGERFRQFAAGQNPSVQMMLPMAEIVGLLQQGVGHLLRERRTFCWVRKRQRTMVGSEHR
jgi:hypothetical protein